ncbi:MAG: hypothetical protein HY369_00580 [Candidatus Aenigmarchaeota archaeon]|nr:hypothetical protein [Candidatus Aenigmarchaeota archaeon]
MRKVASTELKGLRQRVEAWRKQGGGRGARIPEELWNGAVLLARVEGIWATAQALRFNYNLLRDRVLRAEGGERAEGRMPAEVIRVGQRERARRGGRGEGTGGPSFVELAMDPLDGGKKTVIEVTGRHGDRMRIEMASAVDLVGLLRTLCSRGEP